MAWGSEGSGDGQFRTPHVIAVGPDSLVYVTDEFNHRIQKWGPTTVATKPISFGQLKARYIRK